MALNKIDKKMIDDSFVQEVENVKNTASDLTVKLAEEAQKVEALNLDKASKSEVQSLVTNKADTVYVDGKVAAIDRGYGETYPTLAALQSAFPTGNNKRYVVSADGKWYYWNGATWTAGGVFQGVGIADGSVSLNNLEFAKTSAINLATKKYVSGLGITTMGAITTAGAENTRYLFKPIQGGNTYFVRKFDASDRLRVAVFTETEVPAVNTQGTAVFNTSGDFIKINTTPADKSLFILVSATGQEPRINFTEGADFNEYVRPFHMPKEVILPEIENHFLKQHSSQTVVEDRLTGYPSRPNVNSVVWVGVNEPSDAEVFDEWRQIEGFTYFTDFSEYNTVSDMNDWRTQFTGTHEKEFIQTDGNKTLKYKPTGGNQIQRFAFTWDEPSGDSKNVDVEVYAKMKAEGIIGATSTAILIRGSGETTSNFSGYTIGLFDSEIRVYRYINGVSQLLTGRIILNPETFDVTKFFSLVVRVEGSLIKVKCWQGGKEPKEWQITVTDTLLPYNGYIGVFKGSTINYDYLAEFGVGVGGMRAPRRKMTL